MPLYYNHDLSLLECQPLQQFQLLNLKAMDHARVSSCQNSLSFLDRFIHPPLLHFQPFSTPNTDSPPSHYQNYLKIGIMNSNEKNIEKNSQRFITNIGCKDIIGLNRKKIYFEDRKLRFEKCIKIFRASSIIDDFYLNILDWSSKNLIAIGFKKSVYYFTNFSDRAKSLLKQQIQDQICSVKFDSQNTLAVGLSNGVTQLFDVEKQKEILKLMGHFGRISTLDWSNKNLISGSKDGYVILWDVRCSLLAHTVKAHGHEISGLKWNPNGKLFVSGGNDSKVLLYDLTAKKQLTKFSAHRGAIKALDWCPQNPQILGTGGGTSDRHIRFFNVKTLKHEYSIDTGSQICNLAFSKISNQMVTTHGYSFNQINTWRSDNFWSDKKSVVNTGLMLGHTSRVLYCAMSPDGETIATAAADKTVRFWKPFQNNLVRSSCTFYEDLR